MVGPDERGNHLVEGGGELRTTLSTFGKSVRDYLAEDHEQATE